MIATLSVVVTLILFVFYIFQRKYNYWKNKNVVCPKPMPLLGNYGDFILQKKNLGVAIQDICRKYPDEPMIGAFYGTEPVLIVQDPELLKLVTTKDYYYFNGREVSAHTEKEVDTRNLFSTYGDKWKVLRQNLTPFFTSARMKNMFTILETYTRKFETLLDEVTEKSSVQEVGSLIARFTMDGICSCAFGVEANCMASDYDSSNPFRQIGNLIFLNTPGFGLKTVLRATWPSLFYGLGLTRLSPKIHSFFSSILHKVFSERKTPRNDFVDLVMSWKEKSYISGDSIENMKDGGSEKRSLQVDDELLAAQCTLFFSGGYETASATSAFMLFELAKYPEVQERLLAEVDSYIATRGCVQYDCVTELPYLSQCLDETLRMYPVQNMQAREVYADYTLGGVRLVKGDRIHIPVLHLHRNPKLFPEPMEFRPERFSPENRKKIVPYSYMPFGEGPRLCIGKFLSKIWLNLSIYLLIY